MHTSVLLQETIDGMKPVQGGVFVDGTLGMGGHSEALLKACGGVATLVGIDKDAEAIKMAQERLKSYTNAKLFFHEGSFAKAPTFLDLDGIEKIDGMVCDLGVSSFQLDTSGRGFSFRYDEPLHMTMKANPTEEDVTAADAVNTLSETALADVLYIYGEETRARVIARAIVAARPLRTTGDLVKVVESVSPKKGKIHPATRTFQALRIYVNDELKDVEVGIEAILPRLKQGGRLAIITFHSLEDRIVKKSFKKAVDEGLGILVNKKPIVPTREEISTNPRARSAKLRIFEHI